MRVLPTTAPDQIPTLDTAALRARFLVPDLFRAGQVELAYTHHDRMIIGGALPDGGELALPCPDELRAEFFCQRRELAVVNIGDETARVTCDGTGYALGSREVLYVGLGTRDVRLAGSSALYLVSAPAHATHPTRVITQDEATPVALGAQETSNERVIYKYIHADGAASSQLVLGLTELGAGSMWNTMPAHTHDRRTECYLYFGLPPEHRVVHLLGERDETRHLVMADREAVVSPPWSIHCGFGTASYAFVWAMAGENVDYTDVEPAPITELS